MTLRKVCISIHFMICVGIFIQLQIKCVISQPNLSLIHWLTNVTSVTLLCIYRFLLRQYRIVIFCQEHITLSPLRCILVHACESHAGCMSIFFFFLMWPSNEFKKPCGKTSTLSLTSSQPCHWFWIKQKSKLQSSEKLLS